MFSFAGWAFLGNGSFVLKTQGVNIVVNLFCGPAVNAAFGVAAQVTTAVSSFVSNFMQAVNPQITKTFSSGNLFAMHTLIFRSARFSFFLMLFLCLPVMKSADTILAIWLAEVPAHTAAFVRLSFVFCLVDCLVMPVMTGLLAEGNIRNYEIFLVVVNTLNLPLAYFALRAGFPPESVFVIAIIIGLAIMAGRIWLARRAFALSSRKFARDVLLKATAVAVFAGTFAYCLEVPCGGNEIAQFFVHSALIVGVTGTAILFVGLGADERNFLYTKIQNSPVFRKFER